MFWFMLDTGHLICAVPLPSTIDKDVDNKQKKESAVTSLISNMFSN